MVLRDNTKLRLWGTMVTGAGGIWMVVSGRGSGRSGREKMGGKDERTIASVSSVRTSCGHQVEDDSGDLW